MALSRLTVLTKTLYSPVCRDFGRILVLSPGLNKPSWQNSCSQQQRKAVASSFSTYTTFDRDDLEDDMAPTYKNSRDYRGGGGGGGSGFGGGGNRGNDFRGTRRTTNFKPQRDQLKTIDWQSMDLRAIDKDLYEESSITRNRQDSEIRMFWDKHDIKVVTNDGRKPPNPTLTFEEIGFPDYIMKEIHRENFDRPTPIQAQSFPIAMSGRNLVSIAQTGSGKTLGYMLPAIVQINNQDQRNYSPKDGPRALILAPTRELAQQIQQVASQFGSSSYIRNSCLFGGSGKQQQEREVRRGIEICIATPGRLIDFLESGKLSLKNVTYCVLDEADRMLDMGFEPQIRKILSQIRPDRQMLMWSATWPREVQQIAHEFIANYVQINVGSVNLSANHNIKQNVEIVDQYDKDNKLLSLLSDLDRDGNRSKMIVFATTKKRCEKVGQLLNRKGFRAVVMHGDKSQQERDYALKRFRNDHANILVATDVAARGLDVDGIGIVINYDFPQMTEDYVHRIGRTGRKETKGISYTFFTENDGRQAKQLIEIMEEANQEINPELMQMARSNRGGGGRSFNRYGTFKRGSMNGGGFGGGWKSGGGGGGGGGFRNDNGFKSSNGFDKRNDGFKNNSMNKRRWEDGDGGSYQKNKGHIRFD